MSFLFRLKLSCETTLSVLPANDGGGGKLGAAVGTMGDDNGAAIGETFELTGGITEAEVGVGRGALVLTGADVGETDVVTAVGLGLGALDEQAAKNALTIKRLLCCIFIKKIAHEGWAIFNLVANSLRWHDPDQVCALTSTGSAQYSALSAHFSELP